MYVLGNTYVQYHKDNVTVSFVLVEQSLTSSHISFNGGYDVCQKRSMLVVAVISQFVQNTYIS